MCLGENLCTSLPREGDRPGHTSSNLLTPGRGLAHSTLVAMETGHADKKGRNWLGDEGTSGSVETKQGATDACPVCLTIQRLLVMAS